MDEEARGDSDGELEGDIGDRVHFYYPRPRITTYSITLNKLEMGDVAHELGTLPMQSNRTRNHCLNGGLSVFDEIGTTS